MSTMTLSLNSNPSLFAREVSSLLKSTERAECEQIGTRTIDIKVRSPRDGNNTTDDECKTDKEI